MKTVTIKDIRSWGPCYDPAKHLSESFSGTALDILAVESASAKDRLWAVLRLEVLSAKTLRLFAASCAEEALKLVAEPDPRSLKALEVARAYALGQATEAELEQARTEARAARAAADDAAWTATYAAARAAADDAAWTATYAAACAAAYDAYAAADAAACAARAAADDAAWTATYAAACAARAAADAAYADAAYAAADAAACAARAAADAAADAAAYAAAAIKKQIEILKEIIKENEYTIT